ncbi:MAG: sigma-70 family RNA polymerase sigma factor [Clostridiales bacterium]|nr:sigma-70 family RNA polymerase sigma factor [Clostridiales bacterium]
MSTRVKICGIDTSSLPKLSENENNVLLKRAQNGDKEARDEFLLSNTRLVLSVIQKYYGKKDCIDDLFQVGFVGLIKSMDNFDTSFNLKFSTYAVPMIIGEIRRYLRDSSAVRVSRSLRDIAYAVIQAKQTIEKSEHREASNEEIACTLNIPLSKVNDAMDAISDPISLFEPIYHDGNEATLVMDQICDEVNTDEKWIDSINMQQAMQNLSEKERNILLMRYYQGKTQTEISEEIGISQAQVSRLEKNAKAFLLKAMS